MRTFGRHTGCGSAFSRRERIMAQTEHWGALLDRVREQNEGTVEACRGIEQWAWEKVVGHDVVPRELPVGLAKHLQSLRDGLSEQGRNVRQAFDRLCSVPQ